jgi:hypothetical protein
VSAFTSSRLHLEANHCQAEAKATRFLIIILALLHFALALTFKVLFFSYYVVEKIGVDITLPGGNAPGTPEHHNSTSAMLFR